MWGGGTLRRLGNRTCTEDGRSRTGRTNGTGRVGVGSSINPDLGVKYVCSEDGRTEEGGDCTLPCLYDANAFLF